MSDIERTLDLAKRGKFSRSELYWRMQALPDQQREPSQSQAQAFAKFVTGAGRELMQVHLSLSAAGSGGMVGDYSALPTSVPFAKSVVEDDWDRLIRATRKAAGCSENEAIDAALSSEAGRYAFAKRKRADQIATGQFTIADMAALDGAAAEQEQHRELYKRDQKSEYEAKFDEAKQQYPHLSDSKIHDFVRARHPEAWEDHIPACHEPRSPNICARFLPAGGWSCWPHWSATITKALRRVERGEPAIDEQERDSRSLSLGSTGLAVSVCQPSTLRMLIWPKTGNAQSSMAAVSADGSTICVLIRRLNCSCRR
jgi:hypothetical protein